MKWFQWLTGRHESPEEVEQQREQQRKHKEFNEALHRFWADEIIGEPDWEWFLRTEYAIVHTPYGFRDISGAVFSEPVVGWFSVPGPVTSPSAKCEDAQAVFGDQFQAQASLGPMRSWSCPYCAGWAPIR